MQPYFFPYIGYFQLMNAVDKYVIYDDVNFIKSGWIYRNRILVNGEPKYFNLPMSGASSNKLINEVEVNNDEKLKQKNIRIIQDNYKDAPYFSDVYPMLEKIIFNNERNIAKYIMSSFEILLKYLNITTELVLSSSIEKNNSLKGQEKVLEICKILGATEYYNAIGGQELYDKENFKKENIELRFLKTNEICYKQFENEFHSNLSIIDVMMFNSKTDIQKMLQEYELV